MISRPKSTRKRQRRIKKISVTKQQANDYGLIATSYHESAHAVVALINLLEVYNVDIIDSQEGNTLFYLYDTDNIDDVNLINIFALAQVRTIYAGLVGEKMYYKDICGSSKFPMHLKNGSSVDTKYAANLIRKYKLANSGRASFKLKQDVREEVEKVLVRHWGAVKVIAHALYKKKKLDFSELKYLLTRIPEDKDFWKEKFKTIKIIYDEKSNLTTKVVKNLISTKSNR